MFYFTCKEFRIFETSVFEIIYQNEWTLYNKHDILIFLDAPMYIYIYIYIYIQTCHSSSGFSLSQFVLFLHVIPDRLDDD